MYLYKNGDINESWLIVNGYSCIFNDNQTLIDSYIYSKTYFSLEAYCYIHVWLNVCMHRCMIVWYYTALTWHQVSSAREQPSWADNWQTHSGQVLVTSVAFIDSF